MKRVSESLIKGNTSTLEVPSKVTPDDISRAIDNAYSSLYFEKITYELQDTDEGLPGQRRISLNIHVRERKGTFLRIGINYNSILKPHWYSMPRFVIWCWMAQNYLWNFGLGENPRFLASYFKNNGWKPGFGADLEFNNYDIYSIYEGAR